MPTRWCAASSSLPNGTGRKLRVAVFAKGAKAEEAKKAGADIVGAEDLAEQVNKGEINFDRCIATPDMMGIVGRLGKVLGPRDLMPNPKVGTVTMDVTQAIKDAKGGAVEFRVEKAGIVQAGVGKASFTEDAIVAEREVVHRQRHEGQAVRRQGHLHEEDFHLFDDGPGREDRARQRRRGVAAEASRSLSMNSGGRSPEPVRDRWSAQRDLNVPAQTGEEPDFAKRSFAVRV